MNTYQPIYDIAELCSLKGLTDAVLCPGSRCAPLTIAFSRHPKIKTRTFSDERSAAFIALGMSQQRQNPTILLCTSGTAAYNFAPAVAEAFFAETPLIVFTADRPAEWIAQHDGQTIHQNDIFGKHVKHAYQLPQDYDHADSRWAINRIVNEAINLSRQEPRGPVHINAPFREPLYPLTEEKFVYSKCRVIEDHHATASLSLTQQEEIKKALSQHNNILIVSGQSDYDKSLIELLKSYTQKQHIPLAADIITNLHGVDNSIKHTDLFLGQATDNVKKDLQPDLLITFGKSIVSKNLKVFLRKYQSAVHWHIQVSGIVADPLQSITDVFRVTPFAFFNFLNSLPKHSTEKQHEYNEKWQAEEQSALRSTEEFFSTDESSELQLVKDVLSNLPQNCNLHLANSMSVRYANFIGLSNNQNDVSVFSNRGTSGIDGCTSTTVGHSLSNEKINILITGDLAFFYDRNAFWHNYSLPNLCIVVLNNHGGLIFKMIDGPASLPEADEYFVTHQKLNAKKLCEEFEFEYLKLNQTTKAKDLLKDFLNLNGKTKILELESDSNHNKTIFDNFKKKIKTSYEL
jgi:2-succinyl-5-enolpyruvyl-6-hydroxy-3-cyclohexene-1-carboxylate synthase